MITRCVRPVAAAFTMLAGCLPWLSTGAFGGEGPAQEVIPVAVTAALSARFPGAEIREWTREMEGDAVVYDIEFEMDGVKLEADIDGNGSIHNWEREISAKKMPEAAREAVEREYPDAAFDEVMEITRVDGGEEALEGYEVVLSIAGGEGFEIAVSPDGEIREDSADSSDPADPADPASPAAPGAPSEAK